MRIRIIDAFTDRPFAGNPAGVCLLDAGTWPDKAWMRRIAAELSHETAFARPLPDSAGADWALRWFTPAAESNVCGHATLATAHALHTDRAMPLTVRFASNFGLLIARTRPDGTITLDFPAAFPAEAPAPDGLAQALGAKPHATYSHRRARRPARRRRRRGRRPRTAARFHRPGPPHPPEQHPRDHRHRRRGGPAQRL